MGVAVGTGVGVAVGTGVGVAVGAGVGVEVGVGVGVGSLPHARSVISATTTTMKLSFLINDLFLVGRIFCGLLMITQSLTACHDSTY